MLGKNKKEKNGQWAGKNVKYGSLHDWAKYYKSKPLFCEKCGEKKKLDLANISGKYKRDLNDFEWICLHRRTRRGRKR